MKKNNCLQTAKQTVTLIALGMLSLTAQRSSAQYLDLGLKAGIQTASLLNATDQSTGPELDFKNKVYAAVGVGGGYTINKHFGVELDILYSSQGQGYKGVNANGTDSNTFYSQIKGMAGANSISMPVGSAYTADVSLTCLKIPILLRYTGKNTKKVFFSSFIGPQINMISSVAYHVNGTATPLSGTNITAKDVYKSMTIDGVLGLGAGINLSANLLLTAHLRLDYGLGDVEKKDERYTIGNSSDVLYYPTGRVATHNATGGLMIGLNYKFVKKEKPNDAKKPGAARKK